MENDKIALGNVKTNKFAKNPSNIAINNVITGNILTCMTDTWTPYDGNALISLDNGYGAYYYVRLNKLSPGTMTKFRFRTFVQSCNVSVI